MITFSQWLVQEGTAQDLQQIMTQVQQANRLMYGAYNLVNQKATTPQGQQLTQIVKQGWDATLAAQQHIQGLMGSAQPQQPVAQVQQPGQMPAQQQPTQPVQPVQPTTPSKPAWGG